MLGAALGPLGLTHVQFVLLACVWWLGREQGSEPSQRQTAEFAGVDPMMASQVLRTLERRGLLERRLDPRDARARRLVVTPAGAELAERAVATVEAADERFFAPVPDGAALLDALARLAGEGNG